MKQNEYSSATSIAKAKSKTYIGDSSKMSLYYQIVLITNKYC